MSGDDEIARATAEIEAAIQEMRKKIEQSGLEAERLREQRWRTEERRHRELLLTILVAADRIAKRELTFEDFAFDRREDGRTLNDDSVVNGRVLVDSIQSEMSDDDHDEDDHADPPKESP